jgi:hypothetical protein
MRLRDFVREWELRMSMILSAFGLFFRLLLNGDEAFHFGSGKLFELAGIRIKFANAFA